MDSSSNIIKKLRESRLLNERKDYENMDHKDLVKLAQDGDQLALETLMNEYDPVIEKVASKYFLDSGDSDDAKQIASIGFWEAVQKWDGNGSLGSYATMVMNRKLTDQLRKDSAEKELIHSQSASMDAPVATDDEGGEMTLGASLPSGGLSPEEEYLGNDGARKITEFMKTQLSDVERQVILKYIEGYKVSEITEETGMKYKSVENAIKRVKDKLAEYMRNMKESRQIRMNESIFSEEEKEILLSVINKIDNKSITESAEEQSYSAQVRKVLMDLDIEYVNIGEEDDVVYVDGRDHYDTQTLKKVHNALPSAESSGLAERNYTMWFAFSEAMSESQKINDVEMEEHLEVAPNDSTPISKQVAYVKDMVEKAKNVSGSVSADDAMHYAWDIVDFLHDSMLLDKIPLDESKKVSRSRRVRH